MRNGIRAKLGMLAVVIFVAVGCSDSKGEDVLAQDTTLTRDLALANQDTASLPQLKDVPAASEPAVIESAVEPAPAPPPRRAPTSRPAQAQAPQPLRRTSAASPARAQARTTETASLPTITESGNTVIAGASGSERPLGIVSVGSELSLESGQRVCTNTNSVGDRFTARIAEPVMGANGAIIPVGATAMVEISSLKKSRKEGEEIEIGLRVESITFGGKTYAVSTEVTYAQVDKVRAESRGDDVKKVATGAAIGAVLGQIFGGKTKSTVIGAAGGAAAGAVIASRNADYDGCVVEGGRITIRLTAPLTIQVTD
ncbi:MAG TPA: YMGG-like glycine zipper-containing protein [Gemmatimonadaceae bacterium]|nr:YMGG-like glycine zipper-containing protein [Gemmatimonadaceae bacterium]